MKRAMSNSFSHMEDEDAFYYAAATAVRPVAKKMICQQSIFESNSNDTVQ